MTCEHAPWERETSVLADGCCPICLQAEIERLRIENEANAKAYCETEAELTKVREELEAKDAKYQEPMTDKQIIIEFSEKEMAAYLVGHVQALEEAARVVEGERDRFAVGEVMWTVANNIAAAIRALKGKGE